MIKSIAHVFHLCVFFSSCYFFPTESSHSFYSQATAKEQHLAQEQERLRSAETYFANSRNTTIVKSKATELGRELGLCIVIIAAQRPQRYLLQLLGTLVSSYITELPRCELHVLQTSDAVELQQDVSSVKHLLKATLNVQLSHHITGDSSASTNRTWWSRETAHYAQALQLCADSSDTAYTCILEDDALPAQRVLTKLLDTVVPQLLEWEAANQQHSTWVLAKLFATQYWFGWEVEDVPVLTAVGFAVAALVAAVLCNTRNGCLTARHRVLRDVLPTAVCEKATAVTAAAAATLLVVQHRPAIAILVTAVYAALLVVGCLVAIGKQHVLPVHKFRGVRETQQAASTVATLYPQRVVAPLVAFLEKEAQFGSRVPVDVLIGAQFIAAQKTRAVMLEVLPHLFQHIGLYSSNTVKNQGHFSFMKTSLGFDDSP
jgi:cytochrome b